MNQRRPRRASLVARIRAVGGIVVAFINTKGGVSKSTLAYNTACEYAQRGARVLLINTDIQQTVIDADAVRTRPAIITVIPYPHASIWEDLPRLSAGYDVVVIDGQGRNERITRAVAAAMALDEHGVILIPVSASPPDVWATKRDMAPIVSAAAELANWRLKARTVLTRYVPNEVMTPAARESLAAAPVLAPPSVAEMERRTVYAKALNAGLGVCEYEPGGAAAAEISALATEAAELALSEPEPKTEEEENRS